jgi:hypothetical protein
MTAVKFDNEKSQAMVAEIMTQIGDKGIEFPIEPQTILMEHGASAIGPMREGGVAYCHYCGKHLRVDEMALQPVPQPQDRKYYIPARVRCNGGCVRGRQCMTITEAVRILTEFNSRCE